MKRPKISQPFPFGLVRVSVGVKADMAEFENWPADRTAAFFNGIAEVLAASNGQEILTDQQPEKDKNP